jgi:hypothetical protein
MKLTNERYHCPKCWNDLGDDYYPAYEGECSKCGVDLSIYKCQYGKDHGKRVEVGEFMEKMADLIDRHDGVDAAIDYIDECFIFGSWGFRTGMDITFVKDLRGALIAAYKLGKQGEKKAEDALRRIGKFEFAHDYDGCHCECCVFANEVINEIDQGNKNEGI